MHQLLDFESRTHFLDVAACARQLFMGDGGAASGLRAMAGIA